MNRDHDRRATKGGVIMLLCCLIPIIVVVTTVVFHFSLSVMLLAGLLLQCLLLHALMTRVMGGRGPSPATRERSQAPGEQATRFTPFVLRIERPIRD